ncbi:hypothetical protein [uncultured Thiodictyon sp.]|jgi:hypothetical protein|uniref:hypothetical protein n=1 Tax=uncultured Thiodictyon sp. TaxID=1846217 RepID=UPI0025F9AC63|nr:hypothetical protein [uncultured Thiodictyon sp.]
MSNLFLPARFSERIHRLALGVEPLDAAGGARLGHPIQILVEPPAPGLPRPRLVRHLSGLFVMVQDPGVPTALTLRLCDLGAPKDVPGFCARTNRRRLVPRRLQITIPAADLADTLPIAQRARRPALFPGAAYAVTDSVTGLRGRVERAGVPVRWARVEARRPGAGPADPPVGRAHGDDRGEFLLLVESNAAPMTTLERPFELDLVAYPPSPPAPLPPQSVRDTDGLWDLPVETLSAPGAPDPVAAGAFPPAGWGAAAPPVRVALVYGRLLTGLAPLTL